MKVAVVLLLIVLSVVFGVWYCVLGYQARQHLRPTVASLDREIGWLFWWSFVPDNYDEVGKKICRRGQAVAIPILALYALWYYLLMYR